MSILDGRKIPSCGYFMFGQSDEDGKQPGPNDGLNKSPGSSSNTEELKPVCGTNLFPPGSKKEEPKAAPGPDLACSWAPPPGFCPTPDLARIFDRIVECMICLEVGKHSAAICLYRDCVPKNAHVGSGCEVVCRNCGRLFLGRCCGLDEGRAILKTCLDCGKSGHWSDTCPRNDGVGASIPDPLFVNSAFGKNIVAADLDRKMAHILKHGVPSGRTAI